MARSRARLGRGPVRGRHGQPARPDGSGGACGCRLVAPDPGPARGCAVHRAPGRGARPKSRPGRRDRANAAIGRVAPVRSCPARPGAGRRQSSSLGRPGPHHLAQDRELADVVRVVGAIDPRLAEDGVAGRVRDRRLEVDARVQHQRAQGLEVGREVGDGPGPAGRGRGRVLRRPVVVRPAPLDVVVLADVVEDVALGDPQVLEQVPGRVRDVRRERVHGLGREVGDGGFERLVRVPAVEAIGDLFALDLVDGHWSLPFGCRVDRWRGPRRGFSRIVPRRLHSRARRPRRQVRRSVRTARTRRWSSAVSSRAWKPSPTRSRRGTPCSRGR